MAFQGESAVCDQSYKAGFWPYRKNNGLCQGYPGVPIFGVYYWGFLKRYILRRRLLGVILCSLGFVIFDRIYMLKVTNWVVAHSFVVPPYFRHRALLDMAGSIWPVTFNYPLIAVILPLTGLAYFVRSLMQERQLKVMREQQQHLCVSLARIDRYGAACGPTGWDDALYPL